MGKSTHPFVERMNLAKAVHRAMRAGEEKPVAVKVEAPVEAKPAKRTVALTKKPAVVAPQKGVLTALPIAPKGAT